KKRKKFKCASETDLDFIEVCDPNSTLTDGLDDAIKRRADFGCESVCDRYLRSYIEEIFNLRKLFKKIKNHEYQLWIDGNKDSLCGESIPESERKSPDLWKNYATTQELECLIDKYNSHANAEEAFQYKLVQVKMKYQQLQNCTDYAGHPGAQYYETFFKREELELIDKF
ncbi:MAG: hypothetical protein HN595_00395, partial [Flavobacteriaceae bacterium]|nr:hypothetical protein [Flavobacteriaceae bacterium]